MKNFIYKLSIVLSIFIIYFIIVHLYSIRLLPGEYLCNDYIEKLDETMSPLQSHIKEYNIEAFIVGKDRGDISLMPIYNFHDGGAKLILKKDNLIIPDGSYGIRNPKIKIINSKEFIISSDDFSPKLYKYVANSERYVANKILVGEYIDNKGLKYIFNRNGIANFPDRKFEYEIGLDHIFVHCDYFRDNSSKEPLPIYAFTIKNGFLTIFTTSGKDAVLSADKQSLLILKKIK